MTAAPGEPAPAFEVVRGAPTPEELAALTAVLLGRLAATERGRATPTLAPAPPARWPADGFRPPHSWRGGSRPGNLAA